MAEPTYQQLREHCRQLECRVAELEGQVQKLTQLLDQAQRSNKRQAAPFAKGQPKANPRKPGRKSGRHYGVQGSRTPPKPSQIDEIHEARLAPHCPDCHGRVDQTHVVPQYQIDIPCRPIHRQFNVHLGRCRCCGKRVQGRHALQTSNGLGAAAVQLGPNAQAAVVHLNKILGLSHGKIVEVFKKLFGVQLSRGGSARIVLRAARRLQPTYQSMMQAMADQQWQVVDETGWRIGGLMAWLHTLVAPHLTCYVIARSRGHEVAESILGWKYPGVLIHDGWSPYDRFWLASHQTCLAHLLRRCEHLLETATRAAVRFPRQVKVLLQDALCVRDRYEAGQISQHGMSIARGRIQKRLDRLLTWRRADANNERFAAHLAKHRDQLFTFLVIPGIDATTWRAEQALRPAVVNRKVWGGNRTDAGGEAQSILMSVLRTCDQQARDGYDFIRQALLGRRPRLLHSLSIP